MATFDSFAGRAAEMIASIQGGQFTNENKIGEDMMLFLLDMFRAVAIAEHLSVTRNSRNTRIDSSLMQNYRPAYDINIQETDDVTGKTCYTIFNMPAVVMVDDLIDGCSYIGGTDGLSPFARVRTMAELSAVYNHYISKPSPDNLVAYTNTPYGQVQIHGDNDVQEILIQAAFEMPSRLTNIDLDNDRYPVNNSIMARVKDIASRLVLNNIQQTPEDMIQDFQRQLSKIKQQIVVK